MHYLTRLSTPGDACRFVKRHHFNDNKGLEQVEKLATVETRCVVKRFSYRTQKEPPPLPIGFCLLACLELALRIPLSSIKSWADSDTRRRQVSDSVSDTSSDCVFDLRPVSTAASTSI